MLIANFPQWAYITFIIRNTQKKQKKTTKNKAKTHKCRMRDHWLSNEAVKKGFGV